MLIIGMEEETCGGMLHGWVEFCSFVYIYSYHPLKIELTHT